MLHINGGSKNYFFIDKGEKKSHLCHVTCQRGLATIFDHIYFNMGVNQSVIKSNFYSPPFQMGEKIVVLKIVVLNACKLEVPKGNGDIEL